MELQTTNGNILFNANSMVINCKIKELSNVFKEMYKLIPKETKIKDIKKLMTNKISMMLK